jgi:hypothetical protein
MGRANRDISVFAMVFVIAIVLAGLLFLVLPVEIGSGASSRGDFLAPLLAAAALLASGLALTATVRTAGASFRAEEKVKEDIATMLTALRNVRLRLRLSGYLLDAQDKDLLPLVAEQRKLIDAINNSTTGYALAVFEAERSRLAGDEPTKWRNLQPFLLELLESDQPATVLDRALELERLLETLTAKDIRRLAGYVSDLASSTTLISRSYGVIDEIDKARADGKPAASPPSPEPNLELFRQFKANGVDDPDLDMWIAVMEGDDSIDDLKRAVDRGADIKVTYTEVLERHDGTTGSPDS